MVNASRTTGVVRFHEEALGAGQRRVLPSVGELARARRFYLGGGTAVAIYLGHRRSMDFDWFTSEPLVDPLALAQDLRTHNLRLTRRQVGPGTLHGTVSGVNVSYLHYRYPLLAPSVAWTSMKCDLASLDDLACMKLAAVAQRGAKKDFVDVYALGTAHRPLRKLLQLYQQKYEIEDVSHVLVALSYFDDAERERLPKTLWPVSWSTIRQTIRAWVREISG